MVNQNMMKMDNKSNEIAEKLSHLFVYLLKILVISLNYTSPLISKRLFSFIQKLANYLFDSLFSDDYRFLL